MRIARGTGPQSTTSAGKAKAAGKADKASKARFASMVQATDAAEDSTEKARKVRNYLLEELTGLAKEVKEGKTSKEDVTRKFVHLVVKDRLSNGASGAGQAAMVESISEMCESDPSFVTRLHSELDKMARS